MTLYEGLAANDVILGEMEMTEFGGGGRPDCQDCGVRGQVIPSAQIAIPESPQVPPKIPGGPPIVIVAPPPMLARPTLPEPSMPVSYVNEPPPFEPRVIVEPMPRVTNGDVFPMSAPMGARGDLPCC